MKKLLLLSALLIFACSSDSEGNLCIYEPILSTEAVTDITETSATLNGIIAIVSENCEVALGEMQGFVYSTNPSPTNDDNVEVVYGIDISTTIDNLIPNTTYYVRVFITNSLGEFYGNEVDFTTNGENPNAVYTLELDFSDEFPVGHNLGLNYYNDITVGVIDYSENNVRLLTASGTSSYILEGNSLDNLSSFTQVATPAQDTYYSDYVGLGQLIKDDNGTIYSVVHSEEHEGTLCPGNVPGFYASVGLATSYDNGQSFQLSNSVLVENTFDINYDNGQCDGGLGEPSITFSKDSTEVFVYYVDHNRAGRGVNICMSKFNTNSDHVPGFNTPYYLGSDNNFTSEVVRSKEVVVGMGNYSDAIFPQVTYNSYSDSYIMVYSENNYGEFSNGATSPTMSGIYYKQSNDGINWDSPAIQLIVDWSIPWSFNNHSFSWHPNLIYNNEDQTEGYLIYSKANSLQDGHKMWAIKFNIVAN